MINSLKLKLQKKGEIIHSKEMAERGISIRNVFFFLEANPGDPENAAEAVRDIESINDGGLTESQFQDFKNEAIKKGEGFLYLEQVTRASSWKEFADTIITEASSSPAIRASVDDLLVQQMYDSVKNGEEELVTKFLSDPREGEVPQMRILCGKLCRKLCLPEHFKTKKKILDVWYRLR